MCDIAKKTVVVIILQLSRRQSKAEKIPHTLFKIFVKKTGFKIQKSFMVYSLIWRS